MSKKKKSQFGTPWFEREKPRKRPGRHKKRLNKSQKRMYKKYHAQGR
jgi:hypothetical protein